jgi:hypothetical protein
MTTDVILNRSDQLLNDMERAAMQALLGRITESALEQVQPRARGGREVQVKARMATRPTLDIEMLMGRVVVYDQLQVPLGGRLVVDPLQETDELLVLVLRDEAADDRTVQRRKGGKQYSGEVTRINKGVLSCRSTPLHLWQPRLGGDQALGYGSIHPRRVLVPCRGEVKPDDLGELFDEARITAHFEGRDTVRWQAGNFS